MVCKMNNDSNGNLLVEKVLSGACDFDDVENLRQAIMDDKISVGVIEDLVNSEIEEVRGYGTYIFDEVGYCAKPLRHIAIRFAKGSYRQRIAFIHYCSTTGVFDNEILEHMVEMLDHGNLIFRLTAIGWVIVSADDAIKQISNHALKTEDVAFSNLLEHLTVADKFDRVARAIRIGLLVRRGWDIEKIMNEVKHEDSLIFELLGKRNYGAYPISCVSGHTVTS